MQFSCSLLNMIFYSIPLPITIIAKWFRSKKVDRMVNDFPTTRYKNVI